MTNRLRLVVVLRIVFLLSCSIPAFSQAIIGYAQLNGTVQDTNGAVLVKASITLRGVDTNQVYTASANDAGFYLIPSLPPGKYELTATYSGFAKYTQTGIVLTVGQT